MEDNKSTDSADTSLESPGSQTSSSLEQPASGADPSAAASPTDAPADGSTPPSDDKPPKQPGGLKRILKRFNVYLLMFILVVVIAGVVSAVTFLNSKKTPTAPSIVNQNLTQDELKQLANSNATVGDTGQTLTVQGNAIFSGQVLIRSDLNVAGAIKLGGDFTAQNLTASGTVNLANTQAQSLQVANNTTLQGTVTVQHDLNVAGAASFSGPVTAGQITVTNLIMSGNAQLRVPNHIAFTGASPSRSAINTSVLGSGGSASINGSDTTGTVNINTGSGTAPGCFVTVTFNRPFTSTPHVVITPIGSGAGQTDYYVNRSTTSMSICTDNAAPAHQNFAFDYFITD